MNHLTKALRCVKIRFYSWRYSGYKNLCLYKAHNLFRGDTLDTDKEANYVARRRYKISQVEREKRGYGVGVELQF